MLSTRPTSGCLMTCRVGVLLVLGTVVAGAGAPGTDPGAAGSPRRPAVRVPGSAEFSPLEKLAELKNNGRYVWHGLEATVRGTRVVVHYLPGDEAWAQDVLQTALTAIPILERLSGRPLQIGHDIDFWEVRQDDLGLAGINAQEVGILIAPGADVVVHELAHFWVGAHNLSEHWMAEGLADLYDHLVKLQLAHRVWQPPNLWNLDSMCMFDGPLALWQRLDTLDATVREREANRFFYGKSFLFWYALQRVYGPHFVPSLQAWIDAADSPRDSSELLAFLARVSRPGAPTIWDLYPGWLVEGDYAYNGRTYTLDWYLEDDDDDGVWNFEELLTQLDPERADTDRDGLGDGWELYTGGRPRVPDKAWVRAGGTWVMPQWSPVSTGRFVRAGESIRVTARGFWRMAEPSRAWFGPEGLESDSGGQERWGELLGQIGWGPRSGRLYRIGKSKTFTADRDGILYLFARGFHKQAGAGAVLARVEGGTALPVYRAGTRELRNGPPPMAAVRAEGITEVALKGKHVTVVIHPEDLEQMPAPDMTLAYLDRVYEAYADMVGDLPFNGRSILVTFDVTLPDQILVTGNATVLTFGLSHLKALLGATRPSHVTWGLTYGLAIPFLEWHRMDTILEGKGLWAMAELMATEFYEQQGAPVPALEQAKARLRSYRFAVPGSEVFESDKRLAWTFLNALRCDFGWAPFQEMLQGMGTLEQGLPQAPILSDIPLEDFLLEFGRYARLNLNDRFHAWGFPITGRLRQALEPFPQPGDPFRVAERPR